MRALILALMLGGCSVAAQAPVRAMPDWLGGYWLSCEGGRETAENWIGAGTDTMLGTNLTARGFEFLRIAANEQGGLSYYSMPDGRAPPTAFVMGAPARQRAVFENPTHDFPQRIIYERNGDALHARIEGTIDGRSESADWTFQRAESDARCA